MVMASTDRISVLGPFRLSWRDRETLLPERAQRVVAYIALARGGVSRRAAISALWPDARTDSARAALRSTLWRIGRIAPGLIRTDGQRLSLDPAVEIDAHVLDDIVRATLDDPTEVGADELTVLTRADDLLPDWDEDWITVERERMHQVRLEALERLAEDLTERGLMGRAVEAGLAAVADEPYRESAHRVLIEAYLRKGNAAAALSQFRTLSSKLRRELGVGPSDELAERVRRSRGGGGRRG